MNRKSEETKEKQISEVMASIENRVRHSYNQGYEQGLKASKQEPCEEMTREEALNIFKSGYIFEYSRVNADGIRQIDEAVKVAIKALEQEPKTGHWEQYGNSWEDNFKCSECGKKQPKILCGERIIGNWSDYCPNCGAKMVEPQESEG